jgi:hypothetical protein
LHGEFCTGAEGCRHKVLMGRVLVLRALSFGAETVQKGCSFPLGAAAAEGESGVTGNGVVE